MHESTNDMMI